MNLFSHPSLGYPIFHSIDKALPERLRNRKFSNFARSFHHTHISINSLLAANPGGDSGLRSRQVEQGRQAELLLHILGLPPLPAAGFTIFCSFLHLRCLLTVDPAYRATF